MIQWNNVTWYSKLIALILFIILIPALGFYVGTQYETTKIITSETAMPITPEPLSFPLP